MAEWHEGLTERRRVFVEAFAANGGNGTRAAETAGFKSPEVESCRLLKDARVLKAIETLREDTTNKAIATREQRQEFWTRVMLGEEGPIDPETGKPTPHKMADRLKASELLGKSQADFLERVEHSVNGELADRILAARKRARNE